MVTQVVGGRLVRVIWLCAAIHILGNGAWGAYGGGNGTAGAPYIICTAEQLNAIGMRPDDWDKHFLLMADIDLGGYREMEFSRIGTPEQGAFTGTFDGNYHTVSNFRWSSEFARYVGLFGFIDGVQARVMNLTMVDAAVTVESGEYVAVMIGFLRMGTVTNCHVRRSTVCSELRVGGLIGQIVAASVVDCTASATVQGMHDLGGLAGTSNSGQVMCCRAAGIVIARSSIQCLGAGGLIGGISNGRVTECQATCTVEGDHEVGGLIGSQYVAAVERSCADGAVSGTQDVGGLVGDNAGGFITDSYALTKVTGVASVGGLIGYNGPSCSTCGSSGMGSVSRCYAAGPVAGESDVGGLVGLEYRSHTEHCVWDVQVTACGESASGNSHTTLQMQDRGIYIHAGWDFIGESANGTEEVWCMPVSGGYPRLGWQAAPGDLDADGDVDFRDYGRLAEQWRRVDTGFWSHGAWIAADGVIDLDDLLTLAQEWLAGR